MRMVYHSEGRPTRPQEDSSSQLSDFHVVDDFTDECCGSLVEKISNTAIQSCSATSVSQGRACDQ
jgi:hypothetical protein